MKNAILNNLITVESSKKNGTAKIQLVHAERQETEWRASVGQWQHYCLRELITVDQCELRIGMKKKSS